MACTLPTSPQNFVATPVNNNINLSWSAPSSSGTYPVTGYNLYSSTLSSSGPWNQVFTNQNITSFTLEADGNQEYWLQLTAVTSCGEGSATANNAIPCLTYSPKNFTAIIGSTEIFLSWSPIDSAVNYKIYVGTSPNPGSLNTTVSATSATITGLTNGVLYYFKITVVSACGEDTVNYSQISATPSVLTSISSALPTAPINVTAVPIISGLSNSQITISWSAPESSGTSAITGYNIYISTGTNTPTISYTESSSTFTFTTNGPNSISPGTLTVGLTYYISVTATNSSGEGLHSGQVSAIPYCAPNAPNNVAATVGTGTNAGKIILTWSAASGQGTITYSIYGGPSGGPCTTLVASSISALTYTVSGYYGNPSSSSSGSSNSSGSSGVFLPESFIVVASNTCGNSPNSAIVTATPCSLPGSIGNLTASSGCGTVTLAWTSAYSALPITQYNIYTSGAVLIGFVEANILYTTIANTTSNFGVAAVNYCGVGAITYVGSSTGPLTVPSAPSTVTFTPSGPITAGQNITISWVASGSSAVTYTVYLYQSVVLGAIASGIGGTSVTVSTSNWQAGSNYYFEVVAVNICGQSTASVSVSNLTVTSSSSTYGTYNQFSTAVNPSLTVFPNRGVLQMWNFSSNALEDYSPLFPGVTNSSLSSATSQGWLSYQNVSSVTAAKETVSSVTRSYLTVDPSTSGDPIIYTNFGPITVDTQTKLIIRLRIKTTGSNPIPNYFGASLRAAWADTQIDFDPNNSAWCSQPLAYVNDFVTYTLTPPWHNTVGYLAIQIQNLPISNRVTEIDFDYIAIATDGPLVSAVTIDDSLTSIRVAVNGTQVQLWVGRNEFPIFNQNNFLALSTASYEVKFGKIDPLEPQSKFAWGSFKFNTFNNQSPVSRSITDWALQQRLPSTGSVQQLIGNYLGTTWALTDAFQSYRFTDNVDDLTTKAFAYQPDTQTWELQTNTFPRHVNEAGVVDGLAIVRPLGVANFNGTLVVSGQLEEVIA